MKITTTLRNVPDSAKLVDATVTLTSSKTTGERTVWFRDVVSGKSFMVVLSKEEAADLGSKLFN